MHCRLACKVALAAAAAIATHAAADITVVNFENGAEGWEGPQGFGGSTFIDPTNGVGGSAGFRTQFHDFGVAFTNSTNPAFVGDFGGYSEVTVSVDVKVDKIGSFLPVSRPFMLELRDYDSAQGGYPWTSVFYLFDWISEDNNSDYRTYSVTISDPDSTDLPAGWGGYGDYDPDTFETRLPPNMTFADVLAGVDEMVFSTLLPDYFFTDDDFDVTLDNITISTVPAPAAAMVLGLAGVGAMRRRR